MLGSMSFGRPAIQCHAWVKPTPGRSKALLCLCVVAALALGITRAAYAGGGQVTGRWLTIADDGKTPKGVVELVERGGKLHGRIVQLINPPEKNPTCKECSGKKKNQPILGLESLWGLSKDGDERSGGYILDPENGTEYKCYVEAVDNGTRLKVRGYVGMALFGRTQYWRRAK